MVEDRKIILREKCIEFAIYVSDLCDGITGCSVYTNQLIRCSSSIGANVHEAKYGHSTADFVGKMEIALKECYETEYWLELIYRKKKLTSQQYQNAVILSGNIRRMLIASITTAKNNAAKKAQDS